MNRTLRPASLADAAPREQTGPSASSARRRAPQRALIDSRRDSRVPSGAAVRSAVRWARHSSREGTARASHHSIVAAKRRLAAAAHAPEMRPNSSGMSSASERVECARRGAAVAALGAEASVEELLARPVLASVREVERERAVEQFHLVRLQLHRQPRRDTDTSIGLHWSPRATEHLDHEPLVVAGLQRAGARRVLVSAQP